MDNWERVSYAKCLTWLGLVGMSRIVPIALGTVGTDRASIWNFPGCPR